MEAAVTVLAAAGLGQDRAMAVPAANGYLVAIADGAGGMGGGAVAAESLIAIISRVANPAATDWCATLSLVDRELSAHPSGGQTTAVVAFMDGQRLCGASVGDSAAWLVRNGQVTDLTEGQHRKPLLGSGKAVPVGFEAELQGGRLLVASDGLFKYATSDAIRSRAERGTVSEAVGAVANCVRLPSGALQDDVAIVLVSG